MKKAKTLRGHLEECRTVLRFIKMIKDNFSRFVVSDLEEENIVVKLTRGNSMVGDNPLFRCCGKFHFMALRRPLA